MEDFWGKDSGIDLVDCNHKLITDAEFIKKTTHELCEFIDMKIYGECHVVNFGESEEVAGFSMFQLIETSNVSAHFVNKTNVAYFNIFSCKDYDVDAAATFLAKKFEAKEFYISHTQERENY